jgi:signal transduction histidine kinase
VRGVIDLFLDRRRVPTTWWSLVSGLLALVVGTVTFTVTVTLLVTSASLLIVFPLALPVAWLLFTVATGLTRVERGRRRALSGVDIPEVRAPLPQGSWFARLAARARSGARWREIAYLLLVLPLGLLGVVVVMVWSGSLALVALPAYVGALPRHTADFGPVAASQGVGVALAAALGLAGLLSAPALTRSAGRLDLWVARSLLGPRRHEELAARLAAAERGREAAVDTAETERKRIERDLHDGAQQRLVALAMDLGMAREKFDGDPEAARELVADAHAEAKRALVELRGLVRGIHPAILTERGLDAALSSVVARASTPVSLHVDVGARPSAAVESAAYFVVTEALTNVDRHAHADRALVEVVRRDGSLVIEVTDNGDGGADPSIGTGLAGLRERVEALGGWMQVLSPPGGPTTLLVEMPCGS